MLEPLGEMDQLDHPTLRQQFNVAWFRDARSIEEKNCSEGNVRSLTIQLLKDGYPQSELDIICTAAHKFVNGEIK